MTHSMTSDHRSGHQLAAFALLTSIAVSFLAAASAPTPLYDVYQARWGFSAITTTVIFAVYAVAVLGSLLTFGSLSDHLGRRPLLLATLAVQIAAMLTFTWAGGVTALVVARVLQGLATGAAVSAVGGGLLDLRRNAGTLANAVGPVTGMAGGALVSGLLVQYLPAPTHTIYLTLAVVYAAQWLGVAVMHEPSSTSAGALASLRPELHLPRRLTPQVLSVAPALVATWALIGFYGSLGPSLVRQVTGSSSIVLGGLALFVFAGSGAVAILLLHKRSPLPVMSGGAAALVVGVVLTLIAISSTSSWLLFAGAAVGGVGFGAGFQGAIRSVAPLSLPHERAGVLSALYLISYVALGIPTVGAGVLAAHWGVISSARWYGIAVLILAAAAVAAPVWTSTPPQCGDNVSPDRSSESGSTPVTGAHEPSTVRTIPEQGHPGDDPADDGAGRGALPSDNVSVR